MKQAKPKTKQEMSADIASDVEVYLSYGGVITQVEIGVTSNFNPLKKSGFKISPLVLRGSL